MSEGRRVTGEPIRHALPGDRRVSRGFWPRFLALALATGSLLSCWHDLAFDTVAPPPLQYDFADYDQEFLPSDVSLATQELDRKLSLLPKAGYVPWGIAAIGSALEQLGIQETPIESVPAGVLDLAEAMIMPQYIERAVHFKEYVDANSFGYPAVAFSSIQAGDIIIVVTQDYTNMAFMNEDVPHHSALCVRAPTSDSDEVFLQIPALDRWVSLYSLQFMEGFPGKIVVLRLWNPDPQVLNNAVAFGLQQVGKPFSSDILDKLGTSAYYCSQLIWRSFYQAGADLDTNLYGVKDYGIILPVDIYLSPYLWVVASG